MTDLRNKSIETASERFDQIAGLPDEVLRADAAAIADELLKLGEVILERWLEAHDKPPTNDKAEGFRLLALHRQASRGDPSFNACRETCRELVYHRNLVVLEPNHTDVAQRVRLAAMVARHLALFIGGKLEVSGLGEFCCSSRTLRQSEDAPTTAESV
jgi:hypothetical protein